MFYFPILVAARNRSWPWPQSKANTQALLVQHAEEIFSECALNSLLSIDPETSKVTNGCYSKRFKKKKKKPKTRCVFARVLCVGVSAWIHRS